MGPKQTPSKQGNTLFAYFSKSPVPTKSSQSNVNGSDVLSQKKSPNKPDGATPAKQPKKLVEVQSFKEGDIVWSKLSGYPWWPSLVCSHPTENTHVKQGKNPQFHVQFFDTPPTRSWIKAKDIIPFHGADHEDYKKGGKCYSLNPKVRKGTEEADKALKLSVEERLKLVVDLQPSSDEEEEEDEDDENMEINDGNESEEIEADNSKENKESEVKSKHRTSRRPAKRRRVVIASDSGESDDEFKPHSEESSDDEASSGVNEDDISEPESVSEVDSPVKKSKKSEAPSKKRKKPEKNTKPWRPSKGGNADSDEDPAKEAVSPPTNLSSPSTNLSSPSTSRPSSSTPLVGVKTKSKLASFAASDQDIKPVRGPEQESNFPHLKLDFLQPDKIKDAKKRNKDHEEYDPKTLYLPDSFLRQQTPAMRQWWELKSKHFDAVLFFKMGKFYELFHMDAAVGVNELGLIYMKGDHAHSGFPEIAYSRYADALIAKGYKVARIEQTETPDMMTERVKNMGVPATKFDKVVKREICRITTQGTKTFNMMDGDITEASSSYLLALCEKDTGQFGQSIYGVCFVDTTIGKFQLGQFTDDRYCSRLRTLIAHFTPVQVLMPRGRVSEKTTSLIKNNLSSVLKEYLRPDTEFWDSSKTLKVLAEEEYLKAEDEAVWPDCLKKMMSDGDTLGVCAADDYTLAVSSLGAVIWYLQYCLMDDELLSMKNFEEYIPVDSGKITSEEKSTFKKNQHMVLDGLTLRNLDVADMYGAQEGTLLSTLNLCCTPFGNRLFKQWLCAPLCNPASINDRLNAVEDLNAVPEVMSEVTEMIRKLPDLERILSKFHSLGSAARSKKHPDSRAIFFDEAKYSKKKIEDFLSTIEGFKVAQKVAKKFQSHVDDFTSNLLKWTMTTDSADSKGLFPDLKEELQFFDNAFDHSKAKKDGVILPNKGVSPEYDSAKVDLKAAERGLEEYLDRQRQRLGCRTLTYWGSGKNRYQIEVPESILKRVPDEYNLMSSKKGTKRYRTKEIEDQLVDLTEAEERKDAALKDTMRRLFYSFDERYKLWDTALQCLSVLDVLMSLAKYVGSADGVTCRPEILEPTSDTEPFIEIREARHPCVTRTFGGGDFIPNDTVIGIADELDTEEEGEKNDNSKIVLVTGPNMGGKSTLMRQVGLITIMAQMGCYVPAEKCRLTPIDRVFTRLGASDRIMSGESTFFVELSETSAILQHATTHSLVLIDELGRGTATYDGTAIACAVVKELSENICCRTLFSTHYHSLVEEFSHDPNIRLGHMSCMVEDEGDPTEETITFLYKFAKGACPKSYGFNVARLADIPDEVVKEAREKAKEFEMAVERKKLFRSLFKDDSIENIKRIQQLLPGVL
ncbi:DNA mismatch repair protein Msh6-like isoform X2 [Ostrea edulis]|uniref:DNA mismatch repair protein Msh6-like isoform X2 n=1 Tax=Ostrea edulis TaxID=37623 RepID=UPI0024AF834E|nr:DNA mismatch repair protein Msh6-like isoform X2 [Ostrea edulis]